MIDVIYLNYNEEAPTNGYWDMAFLDDLFSYKLWQTVYNYSFNIKQSRSIQDDCDGAVIILPARSQIDYVDKLNKEIKKLKWVLLFIVGDEEALYPIEKIKHNNIKIYTMYYKKANTTAFINGYPSQIHDYLNSDIPDKKIAWFFSGQITHKQRKDFADVLDNRDDGILYKTDGFTKGLKHEQYYELMKNSIVAPCPGGPQTPDTFRLYEALENAAVPILATKDDKNYWQELLGYNNLPVIDEPKQINGYIDDILDVYPKINNDVFAWWIRYKRDFAYKVMQDIDKLSGIKINKSNNITAIVPVSVIKSHPDIKILDETIKSIRHHLPYSEIILTFDGIREEQLNKQGYYEEFIRRILWKCNTEYKNVVPIIFNEHSHQVKMARKALEYVKTDYILYVEQDTPLVIDYEIPLHELTEYINDGISNMIRFHFEAHIPKEHMHMIHGVEGKYTELTRTSQWSQRPHLSSTAFYKRILNDYFTQDANSFIEDKMHSVVDSAYRDNGTLGWNQFRVHVYTPEENIKRSYHTDGRAGEAKYDNMQVF